MGAHSSDLILTGWGLGFFDWRGVVRGEGATPRTAKLKPEP